MPHLNNNQYESLSGKEDYEGNDNEITGVENGGEIIGVRHDD